MRTTPLATTVHRSAPCEPGHGLRSQGRDMSRIGECERTQQVSGSPHASVGAVARSVTVACSGKRAGARAVPRIGELSEQVSARWAHQSRCDHSAAAASECNFRRKPARCGRIGPKERSALATTGNHPLPGPARPSARRLDPRIGEKSQVSARWAHQSCRRRLGDGGRGTSATIRPNVAALRRTNGMTLGPSCPN
jgi:hypothetical protein